MKNLLVIPEKHLKRANKALAKFRRIPDLVPFGKTSPVRTEGTGAKKKVTHRYIVWPMTPGYRDKLTLYLEEAGVDHYLVSSMDEFERVLVREKEDGSSAPIEYECPYEECTGTVAYPEESCPSCNQPIVWEKDPDRDPPIKPIRPGGGEGEE